MSPRPRTLGSALRWPLAPFVLFALLAGSAGCPRDPGDAPPRTAATTPAPAPPAELPAPPPGPPPAPPATATGSEDDAPAEAPEERSDLPPGTPQQQRSLQIAKTLALSGSCAAAEPHLEAVAAGPLTGARISALLMLGECYRTEGRTREVLALYERARGLAPAVPEVHAALGRAYLEAGQTEDAREALSEATRLEPRLLSAQLDLGVALLRLGRRDDAAQLYLQYEGHLRALASQSQQGTVEERRAALEVLGLVQDELALRAQVAALVDPDEQCRLIAASSLAESESPLAREALNQRLLEERSPEVRSALRQALDAQAELLRSAEPPPPAAAPPGVARPPAAEGPPAAPAGNVPAPESPASAAEPPSAQP